MGDFKINEKSVFTQSGSAEPAMGSTVTDIPAAGVTGVLPSAVTGGSGLTALGTVATGTLGSAVIQNGVTDASSASAGKVGEVLSSPVAGVSISDTLQDMDTLVITAGDWDVSAFFSYLGNAAAYLSVSINTTSATLGTQGVNYSAFPAVSLGACGGTLAPRRYTVSGNTTLYLIASKNTAVAGTWWYSTISARRIR